MKVLVLGGNGFIGSHIVDFFFAAGNEVAVLDIAYEKFREPLSGVKYYIGNYGDKSLIDVALRGVDLVVHAISSTIPVTSNENPIYDVQSNLINTIALLHECVNKSIKRIIYLSSGGAVYGTVKSLPVNEEHVLFPQSSYGIVKLAVEKYLYLFNHLYGLEFNIIRPSNPYGARQNPYGTLGSLSVFLGKISRKENIQIWGDGSVARDYIYVSDLVKAIYSAAITEHTNQIYNIGSGKAYTLNQLLIKIRDVLKIDFNVQYMPSRPCDVSP